MSGEAITVIISLLSFGVVWSASILGGMAWLGRKFDQNREETANAVKDVRLSFEKALAYHDGRIRDLEHWRISRDGWGQFGGSKGPSEH